MENQKSNERGITGVTYPVDDSPFTSSTINILTLDRNQL